MYITHEPYSYAPHSGGISFGRESIAKMGNLARWTRTNLVGRGETVTQQVVQSVLVSGGAFGFGVLGGAKGAIDVLGVPIDLGAGILLQLAGFAGLAGKWDKVLHDVGDGALAAYFARLGARVGHNWARRSPRAAGERVLSSGERRVMTPAEVQAAVMANRA